MRFYLIRPIQFGLYLPVLVMIVLGVTPGASLAQITAQEFNALPDADKRTVLVSSLEERERSVRNLRATSVTRIGSVAYRDGTPRSAFEEFGRYDCELRRGKGGHWAKVNWFLTEQPDRPVQQVITSLNINSGIARSIAKQDRINGVHGAISTKEDSLIKAGRFFYWFGGTFDSPREFLLSFLLQHQQQLKFEGIEENGQEIRVSLEVETNRGTPHKDTRTIWIDPRRGFMPVRMHWYWKFDTPPPILDQNMVTEVKKMEQVNGVWIPTHFTETCTCEKSIVEGYATVYETTVSNISLGTVTEEDLYVSFPNGTEVHDRLKGVRFRAGESTQTAPEPGSAAISQSRTWLVTVNLVTIVLLSAAILFSKYRKRARARTTSAN